METPQARPNRFQAGLPASLELDGRTVVCIAENVSRAGALLVGDFPPPDTMIVRLVLSSPGGDLRLPLAGRVVRCPREQGLTRLAVEFIGLEAGDQATLEALVARVIEGGAPVGLACLPPNASLQQIREALETIPLAHRIQLAMRALPKERALLLHDDHLEVLDGLARNPNLLAHEVMALLRMPGILPRTVESIGKDSRWKGNEQVTLLVLTHRNTPLALGEQILARMPLSAFEKVIRAPGLHPALKDKVLKRLPRR